MFSLFFFPKSLCAPWSIVHFGAQYASGGMRCENKPDSNYSTPTIRWLAKFLGQDLSFQQAGFCYFCPL